MSWREATFGVWAVVGAALVAVGVVTARSRGRLPTAADLCRVATAGPGRRTVVLLAWMWLGWHAFAR